METLIICISNSLFLLFLHVVNKFLNNIWWNPMRIKSMMTSQGITGPSYRFLHGNTKETIKMENEIKTSSMELSHDLVPRIQPHIYEWSKLYGKNFLIRFGPQAVLVVTESVLIKENLSNKDKSYPKTKVKGHTKKLLGNGLVTAKKEKWYRQRKLANQAFHAESLKGMIPAMITSTEMMLERWKHHEGQEIEVFQEFKFLTAEVISRTAFGSSYMEGKKIFEMLTKMAIIISSDGYKVRIPGVERFFKTRNDIETDKLQQRIRDFIIEMIKKREAAAMVEGRDSYGNDFLGSLIKANHEVDESKKLSIDDLIDECMTFFVAGHGTTSDAPTWTVLLLAIHTDWQDKARAEVLHPHPDGISKLKTMSMIINETLRLYSPIASTTRTVDSEVELGEFIVPAGMDIGIPFFALHRDPQVWGEDVHLFKPERFAQGLTKATNNNTAAFLPFGYGPRSCVDMTFAATEAKIALSMLRQRYKFTLSPNYVHSPVQVITVCPQHGVQVILQPLLKAL